MRYENVGICEIISQKPNPFTEGQQWGEEPWYRDHSGPRVATLVPKIILLWGLLTFSGYRPNSLAWYSAPSVTWSLSAPPISSFMLHLLGLMPLHSSHKEVHAMSCITLAFTLHDVLSVDVFSYQPSTHDAQLRATWWALNFRKVSCVYDVPSIHPSVFLHLLCQCLSHYVTHLLKKNCSSPSSDKEQAGHKADALQ